MAQLQARNSSGQMGFADAPDGSFVGSSNGTCPAGYNSSSATFNPSGGGFASPFNAFICVPAPQAPVKAPKQAAPKVIVKTTVNPNVNVSPQISPVFQQQFQPSNSPASAGTSQNNSTNTAIENAEARQRQIQQELELQQLREQLARQQQTQNTGAQPVIGTQPPTIQVPTGGVTQLPTFSQPPATLNEPDTSFQAPPLSTLLNNPNVNQVSTAPTGADQTVTQTKPKIWLIGLGLVAAAIMLTAHSKRRTPVRARSRKRLATR